MAQKNDPNAEKPFTLEDPATAKPAHDNRSGKRVLREVIVVHDGGVLKQILGDSKDDHIAALELAVQHGWKVDRVPLGVAVTLS